MSAEWLQQQRGELRNIAAAIHVKLDDVAHDSAWCPRCHTQLKNREETIAKHLFICKLQDIAPNPKLIPHEAPVHQFYYTHCPAVVSFLQPPQQLELRDYAAELQHTPRPVLPGAPAPQWSDMIVDQGPSSAPLTTPRPAASDATMQVREYAVSTQGRGAELLRHTATLTAAQRALHRVNQCCAALWQEQQSLAARSQFYEAVEWTARAEREQSGVASVDAQALDEWLASSHAQHQQINKSRRESEREQRSRPEKYRAKNLTKKRPAELQRDLVQLLFAQISATHETRVRDSEREPDRASYQDRERGERENYRERERHYHAREHEHRPRERDREGDRGRDRGSERDRDRDREGDRDRGRERREREDRSREDSDRKRRRESSEEYEHNKRQRYQ